MKTSDSYWEEEAHQTIGRITAGLPANSELEEAIIERLIPHLERIYLWGYRDGMNGVTWD